ncbi:hypothetical protein M0802_007542 [Mischocyttarus mexicanus]|nr:hypothetical protein M0802_007542 [Mischocyttarus mexicanus]
MIGVRATLAEKEVSALKEQLANANDGNIKTEGHQLSQNSQGSDQQQHDASNPRRTPNSNLEQELQAKDKEGMRKKVANGAKGGSGGGGGEEGED